MKIIIISNIKNYNFTISLALSVIINNIYIYKYINIYINILTKVILFYFEMINN